MLAEAGDAAAIPTRLFGLTRGQWLSVAVFFGGVALMAYVVRKKDKPMGGWTKRTAPGRSEA